MVKFLVISFLTLLTACAGTRPSTQATRYPQVDQVWKQDITIGIGGNLYLDEYYDVIGDKEPDVILRYIILARSQSLDPDTDVEQMRRSLVPVVFMWIDKDQEPYAWQYDFDQDGKIESYSGDVKRLNKALDKTNN